MKNNLIVVVKILILMLFCQSDIYAQGGKEVSNEKLSESEIYFASKRINESFSEKDTTIIDYVSRFLKEDSIKVTVEHSIEEGKEVYYLKGDEKLNFFYCPEDYTGESTRQKSVYFDVKGNCYVFNNEGISHNSFYIKKLCYSTSKNELSLVEMYLLDGD